MKAISKNNNVREISVRNLWDSYLIPHYDLHLMPKWAAIKPSKGRHRFAIHTERNDGESNRWDFKINPQQKYPLKINLREIHMVNGIAKDIFKIINGAKTSNEVYNNLLQHHDQAYGTKKKEVHNFLKDCIQKGLLSEVDTPVPISIHRTGSEESTYPVHVSIEVTSACNLRCLHCYGEFDEVREDAIDANKVISILAELAKNGCCTVELTGGECTIHPEFERILSFCCSHMDLVGILTNGVAIRDKTAEIIIDNADKCTVQICINGNEEYHNKFTRSKIAYRRAVSSVEKLASGGVFVSTPMNLTLDNYMMIEETCEKGMSMGSARFQAAWVQTEFGRARELYANTEETEECKHVIYGLTCKERFEILKRASDIMLRLHEKYPLFAHIEPAKDMLKITDYTGACGAGSRSIYIASNGQVCICPMAVESEIPMTGNITKSSWNELLNSEFSKQISSLRAPNSDDCGNCTKREICGTCILYGIREFMVNQRDCSWGVNNKVDKLIKNGFFAPRDAKTTHLCGGRSSNCPPPQKKVSD